MNKRTRHIPGLLASMAVLTAGAGWCSGEQAQPASSQPVTALRTWAVLASDELRKSGLDDQIMAGLGVDRTITLVDREHLALVARELALSGLLEAHNAGSRRKAGAAIRADALAILHLESAGGESFVRLVICETRAGARLAVECFPYKTDHPDEAGKAIVAAIERTRRRFRNGVQRVYAVAPFVSRDLGHQYDYLQRGCASLLAGALGLRDGVAVVEIDEARQIAGEIGLTDGADIRRFVPLLIEGEYEVTRGSAGKEATIRFAVKVTGNGKPVTVPDRTVKLSEMAGYLSSDLPGLIVGNSAQQERPLTADQQAAALVARADVFARLGAWEHSTALREAALLLADDPATRTTLVEEYHRLMTRQFPASLIHLTKPYDVESRRRADLWGVCLAHIEYLVRNRQISLPKAVNLTKAVLGQPGPVTGTLPNAVLPGMEERKRRFLRDVYPLALSLAHEAERQIDRDCEDASWNHTLMGNTLSVYDKRYDLEHLREVALHQMPRDLHPADRLMYFVLDSVPFDFERDAGAVTKENALAFLNSLAESDHPVCRLLGRCALLRRQWLRERDSLKLEAFALKVDALLADYVELEAHLRPDVRKMYPNSKVLLHQKISDLHSGVKRAMTVSTDTDIVYSPAPPEPSPVSLEPLDVKVRQLDGEVVPFKGHRWRAPGGWNTLGGMVKCGQADVYYNHGAVLVMKEKGLLEEIRISSQEFIDDVKWDGRHLWLAIRGHGVQVLDLDGKTVAEIGGSQGLPECDRALKVCPLRPGTAIVGGALGEHGRMWVAAVRVANSGGSVNVFHRATRVLAVGESLWEVTPTTDMAGEPCWMVKLEGDGREAPVVLLGWGWQQKPLRIDTESLKVSFHDVQTWSASHRLPAAFAVRGRRLIQAEASDSANVLIDAGGRIFQTGGGLWGEVDLQTGKVMPLGRLPAQLQLRLFGFTAHYGIVGWTGDGDFYRLVAVNKSPDAASRPATGLIAGETKRSSPATRPADAAEAPATKP